MTWWQTLDRAGVIAMATAAIAQVAMLASLLVASATDRSFSLGGEVLGFGSAMALVHAAVALPAMLALLFRTELRHSLPIVGAVTTLAAAGTSTMNFGVAPLVGLGCGLAAMVWCWARPASGHPDHSGD